MLHQTLPDPSYDPDEARLALDKASPQVKKSIRRADEMVAAWRGSMEELHAQATRWMEQVQADVAGKATVQAKTGRQTPESTSDDRAEWYKLKYQELQQLVLAYHVVLEHSDVKDFCDINQIVQDGYQESALVFPLGKSEQGKFLDFANGSAPLLVSYGSPMARARLRDKLRELLDRR